MISELAKGAHSFCSKDLSCYTEQKRRKKLRCILRGRGSGKESQHSRQRGDDNADKRKNFLRFFLRNGIYTALALLLGNLSPYSVISQDKN